MLTATFRGMVAHKLRLVLTTASIALGVAFLAGTLVLTDTMGLAFEQLFGKVSAGTDAVVRTEAAYTAVRGRRHQPRPDRRVRPRRRRATSTASAPPRARSAATRCSPTTTARPSSPTAARPPWATACRPTRSLRGDVELLSGTAPDSPNEVAIDATSAEENDIALGSTIKVLFQGPTQEFTVVGTVGFGGEKNLGGTTSAYFDTATAQKLLGTPGQFDAIDVSAEDGVSQTELAERLNAVVPDGTEAVTGETVAKENSDAVEKDLKIVGHPVHDLRRHRAVRRLVHHLEHLHDDRHPALAGDRAAAGDRRHPAPGAAQPAARGGHARGRGLGDRRRPRAGRRQGPQGADGRGGLQPAEHVAAGRAPHHLWSRCSSARSSPWSPPWSRPAAPPRCCRSRRCASRPRVRRSRPSGAPSSVSSILGAGVAGMLSALYGGAGMKLFGLGLVAALVGVMVSLPLAVRPLAALIATPLRAARHAR